MKQEENMRPLPGPRGGARMLVSGSKAGNSRYALSRLWHVIGDKRGMLVTAILFSIGSVAANAVGPWQLGLATDMLVAAMQGTFDQHSFIRQLLTVVLIYITGAGLNMVQAWLINDLAQALGRRLRAEAQAKLSRVPLSWFDAQPHGEVLSRFTNDIDNLVQNLQQVAGQALMMLLTILGVVAIMFVLSPLLAVIAVISVLLSVVVSRLIAARARPFFAAQWQETGHLNATVEETFSAQALIRVFGAREQMEARFASQNEALMKAGQKAQIHASMIQPLTMFVTNLAYIAVITTGAFRVLHGVTSVGELQAFIQYIRQLGHPVSQLSSMAALVQSALASAERVFELLDAPEMSADEDHHCRLPAHLSGHVQFQHVSFRYVPGQPLFEDVSLEALPAQTVAIVGPTGAGKTTLVNLLMRFYDIDGGAILLDGCDIRDLSRSELRRSVSMVLQDTWLFTGTVHDNIAYGRPDADRGAVIAAARRCHVDEFIRTLPDGYDSVLDNAGESLSQGQRQLLTIARAFLLDTPVLILDEATSSVDTRTEMLIQQAMGELRQGRTSFVIAHRLSTVRSADVIVYMEHGNVRESGSHDELMALRGGYWQLNQSLDTEAAGE